MMIFCVFVHIQKLVPQETFKDWLLSANGGAVKFNVTLINDFKAWEGTFAPYADNGLKI